MRIGRTAAWVEHGKDAPYHDLTTFPVEKKREKISFCRGIKTIGLLMDGRLILGRSDRNSGPGQSERVQCLLICPPCSYQPRHVLANPRRRGLISTSLVISPSTLHCSSPPSPKCLAIVLCCSGRAGEQFSKMQNPNPSCGNTGPSLSPLPSRPRNRQSLKMLSQQAAPETTGPRTRSSRSTIPP